MPRVEMIEEREQATPAQVEVFDHIAASRGRMIRPFAAMLHRPEIARAVADVGAVIRYQGTLSDHVRELVICTTAIEEDCPFEWESHSPPARAAGIAETTLEAIRERADLPEGEASDLVGFVRQIAGDGHVTDDLAGRLLDRFGEQGFVELAAIVGYYALMAAFMRACEAC